MARKMGELTNNIITPIISSIKPVAFKKNDSISPPHKGAANYTFIVYPKNRTSS
jgi:hypothetical protein